VIQRDRHGICQQPCADRRDARKNRHRNSALATTEVREAEERLAGTSAAAPCRTKRHPVTCEQISGLARIVRSNMIAAFEKSACGTSAIFA